MKKWVFFGISVLLLLPLLAGCQGKKASGGAIKLEFYNQKGEHPRFYEELAAMFTERNPGITIEVVSPPDSESALFARISTGDVPDIIHLWPTDPSYQDVMEEGFLLDLTGQDFLSRALPEYVEMSNNQGKSYSMPTTISTFGLWYNKGIFAKYNLKPPETFDELIAVCKTLKNNGVQAFAFRDKDPSQEFERLIGITNPDITTTIERVARGETSFSREPELRALAEAMLTVRQYGQSDTLGTDNEQATSDFLNQKAAMITHGSWMMADVRTFPDLQAELIPYPNPVKGRQTKMAINVDIGYSISANLSKEETDAALKFIDFLTSPEIAQLFADRDGSPSVIKGITQTTPELASSREQVANGNTFLTVINFWPPGFRNAWVPAIQDMLMTRDVGTFITASDSFIKSFYQNR